MYMSESVKNVYSYNDITKTMYMTFFLWDDITAQLVERPELTIDIDLSNNRITQQNVVSRLSSSDNYIFLEFMKQISATDELMLALLSNEYYTKTFLSDSLGVFVVPFAPDFSSYFYVFSSLVLPYENLYMEQILKPKYAVQITSKYDENNIALLRKLKEILRDILVVPGIPITPFIYLATIAALKKMS